MTSLLFAASCAREVKVLISPLWYLVTGHGNGSKLHQGGIQTGHRKNSFTVMVVIHKLPREVVDVLNQIMFKKHMVNDLNDIF